MRPIDADEAMRHTAHARAYDPEALVIGKGFILEAPTIFYPCVSRGKWIPITEIWNYSKQWRCSICGEPYLTNHHNYCPNCGARMGANNEVD